MDNTDKLIITPKTKVLQLIESYPELENILIEYAPAFKKLKNPVLRKTVAKIATLQQAASIGEVKVEELINRLRKEVGQDDYTDASATQYNFNQPDWFMSEKVISEFNAREMLAAGEHPVNQVIADLKKLNQDEIYKLLAPFLPAPLIDKALSLNMQHWVVKESPQDFVIYFCKT